MDRHDLPGITAHDVAAAHQADLRVQERFGCRGLTYWFDKERETAFCLIEAPDGEAVKAMHDAAHGMMPYKVIEVNSQLVESFLGRIEDPPFPDPDTPIILNDPAFRAILASGLRFSDVMDSGMKTGRTQKIRSLHRDLVRQVISDFGGSEAEHRGDCLLASFASVSQAVLCAVQIQKDSMEHLPKKLQVQIGLSAGIPVTESDEFFGPTISSARHLCRLSDQGQLNVSSTVSEYFRKDRFNVLDKKGQVKIWKPLEEDLVHQLMTLMESSWNKERFSIHDLAEGIGVSKSKLYRKTISLTGLSPSDFMKEYRLEKALGMIEKQGTNISEVAYGSGFSSPSYFSKCFKKRYGILPSEYAT
jgi:AraC-like DNA-binding protein